MERSIPEHDQDSDPPRTAVSPNAPASGGRPAAVTPFVLRSADVREGETMSNTQVFRGMGCSGQNVSPALEWSGAPAATKSFAVTLYDPDAPTGSGWWHWVMYNIPPNVSKLPPGAGDPAREWLPGVTHGNTDFGKPGYGGPCPPAGDPPHRYIFTMHALDVQELDVPTSATAAMVGFNLHHHVLGRAVLTGRYGR
jgi:Raf kinase inhibitor-like YbhB/YbcL family protein